MNILINGWNTPQKGAMTSVLDVILDHAYDKMNGMETCGFECLNYQSYANFNYRATPYRCLKKLFLKLSFNNEDHLVDLGSGKGRVYLYASLMGCHRVTGVEYHQVMAELAKKNYKAIACKIQSEVTLLNIDVRKIQITPSMNIFFLFTPFHLKIFARVLSKIKISYLNNPRKITVIFYRPDIPWMQFMQNDSIFIKRDTVKIFNDPIFELFLTA